MIQQNNIRIDEKSPPQKPAITYLSSSDEEDNKTPKKDKNKKRHTISNEKRKVKKTTNRGTSEYHQFVHLNYGKVRDELKREGKRYTAQDIIPILSKQWKLLKHSK